MRLIFSTGLASALLVSACTAEAQRAQDDPPKPADTAAPSAKSAMLAKASGSLAQTLDGVLASCGVPARLEAPAQDSFTLVSAADLGEGRVRLSTGLWSEEDAAYRDFVLQAGRGTVRAADGALEIVADYRDTSAYGYALDKAGEIVFAGPPPIEFPHAIPCDDPDGALDALRAAGLSDFISSGMTAEDHFRAYAAQVESDPRFQPVLDSCEANGDAWLMGAGYVDKPGYAYQGRLYVTVAQRYSDGFGTTTLFIPPDRFDFDRRSDSTHVTIRSEGETASGFTNDFSDQGPSSETNDFEDIEASVDFQCEDSRLAKAVFTGFNRWRAQGRSEAMPVGFSVHVDNAGLSCDLSAAALAADLSWTAWRIGAKPRLDFETPDIRVKATAVRASSDSATGCEYEAVVESPGLGDPIRPYPARNQAYEQGTELVYDGFFEALDRLRQAD